MNRTVYYLEHRDTGRRLKYYNTLAGARIAQRARLTHQGFGATLSRHTEDDREWVMCATRNRTPEQGTWIIVEDTIDSVEVFD